MIFKLALPILLASSLGSGSFMMKHAGHSGCGFMKRHGMIAQQLELTDAQKQAFKGVFDQHKAVLKVRAQLFFEARSALLDAALDPVNSTESLRPLQLKTSETAFALAKEVRAMYLDLLPLLTDSQRAKARLALEVLQKHTAETQDQVMGRHHGMLQWAISERLGLSEAQLQSLQKIREAHQPALQAQKKLLHEAAVAAVTVGMDPKSPEDLLRLQQQKVAEAAFALGSEVRATYLESLPILTPEQREQGKSFISQLRMQVESLRKLLLGF